MRKCSHQLSFSDVYSHCKNMFDNDKPEFLALLENYIDFSEFIPRSFHDAFYKHLGRNREYPLYGFIAALIIQKVCSIPSITLLITFLKFSAELRKFCGFTKVPDPSKFSNFKTQFWPYLALMFDNLVEFTEPICQAIDKVMASSLIYDTSGIEAYVTENNDKYSDTLIRKLKAFYKNNPNVDPYAMAYGLMPSSSAADPSIKQMYINGHFCYAHKFGILTNGLGIARHIAFLDDDFKSNHPEVEIEKKSDSPDEDKSIGDSTSLQPVLNDFFKAHPNLSYDIFLGDSAFDAAHHYLYLKDRFDKVLIPLNSRNTSDLPPIGYNEYGYPTCPNDNSLAMKYRGITKEKGRADRIKWVCPKVSMQKGTYICSCENPCSDAICGRTSYTYQGQDFRMFPGIQRDSNEWNTLYKKRCVIERTINHFKTNMCVADRKTRNLPATKADLFLSGIAQLLTVILADRLKSLKLFRSLKPLIA